MRALPQRLAKFNLILSPEKTRLLRFSRFEPKDGEAFDFLGFTYRWGVSRKGRPLVRMATSKKKLKGALQRMKGWLRTNCRRLPLRRLINGLRPRLQGHWNYYGVCGNYSRMQEYYGQVIRLLHKWLNRRSQRRSYSWSGLKQMLAHYPLPRPRIIAYWD